MAKSHRSTEFESDIPDGLQAEPRHWGTCYIGTRPDIVEAGILPAQLLPKKFQSFAVVHNEQQVSGGKWGWGKWTRWEIRVYHVRRTPTLTLIPGSKAARE